jgi:hypothetical protein
MVKTQAMLKAESILERYKKENDEGFQMDLRKNKGRNRYAEIVFNSFETIQEMLSRGYSPYRIFQILKSDGAFEVNAHIANFYKALERERLRRGSVISSAAAARKSVTKDEKAKEQERDGNCERRIVSINGRDVSIPVHVPDDLKSGRRKERYSFSDYPKYIQDAIRESERKGTLLEDREKNSRIIRDWIDQQGSEAEN